MVQKAYATEAAGIDCGTNAEKLANGQCSFNIYKAVGIRKDQPDTEVGTFVQDIFLSATFFIGTVVAVALIYLGIKYIMAKDDKGAGDAKNGIKWSLIGLALVMLSYSIIRLVQYIATG